MIYLYLTYQFKILDQNKKINSLFRNVLIYGMNLLFRFVTCTCFVTELSWVDFHTYKRPFLWTKTVWLFRIALARISTLKKLQLSYTIKKGVFLSFFHPA